MLLLSCLGERQTFDMKTFEVAQEEDEAEKRRAEVAREEKLKKKRKKEEEEEEAEEMMEEIDDDEDVEILHDKEENRFKHVVGKKMQSKSFCDFSLGPSLSLPLCLYLSVSLSHSLFLVLSLLFCFSVFLYVSLSLIKNYETKFNFVLLTFNRFNFFL